MSGQTQTVPQHNIGARTYILDVATAESAFVDVVVSITQLDGISLRQVVGSPGLFSAPSTSHPASDQVSVICVTRTIARVPIKSSRAEMVRNVEIAGDTLYSKIHFRDLW